MPTVGLAGRWAVVPTGTLRAPVPPAINSPGTCVNAMSIFPDYAVYVELEVNEWITYPPVIVTVPPVARCTVPK
jgi:hypothetical protein